MPHARGVARVDATHLKRGSRKLPKKKTVAFPVSSLMAMPPATILLLGRGLFRRPELDAIRHHACFDVTPERDQELSCHCHDGDPARAPL